MIKKLRVIVGPSGSGKRTRMGILEDISGCVSVTRLDPDDVVSVCKALAASDDIASRSITIEVGIRSIGQGEFDVEKDRFVESCLKAFAKLEEMVPDFKIIVQYCHQQKLLNRQSHGFHPLQMAFDTLEAAIFKECEILVQLFCEVCERFAPDRIVFSDTTNLSPEDMVKEVSENRKRSVDINARAQPNGVDTLQGFYTRGWNKMRETLTQIQNTKNFIQLEDRALMKEGKSQPRVNVLLLGENGTGKEIIARALDKARVTRERGNLQVLDANAITETLFESELFGKVKGSYTDAKSDAIGLVSRARNGTLFLDEIDKVAKPQQAKLLRFLEGRCFKRVGDPTEYSVENCRIVAATSKDLEQEVQKDTFLRDLFYRLAGTTISIPPLRQRREDIPLLLKKFTPGRKFTSEAMVALFDYDWPGNVRELEQYATRWQFDESGKEIRLEDLPERIVSGYLKGGIHNEEYFRPTIEESRRRGFEEALDKTVQFRTAEADLERAKIRVLIKLLTKHHGDIDQVIEEGVFPGSEIGELMEKYQIRRDGTQGRIAMGNGNSNRESLG